MNLPGWVARPQVHAAGCLLSLLAALAVVAFAIGTLEYTNTRGKLLLTALLVAGYFLTMMAATAIPWTSAGRWLRAGALAAASVAVLLMVLGLWGTPDSDAYWKATAIVTVVTMGAVAVGVALPRRPSGPAMWTIWVLTASAAAALAVLGIVGIATEYRAPAYWWVFGLLVVAWLVAGVAAVVARRLQRRRGTSE